jgi:hypothetical protein
MTQLSIHIARARNGGEEALCQAPNKQLQRTVIRRRVRAAGAALPVCARGAHDTLARGR